MIEVEVGDTIVEFPDGTPPDVMKAALQKRFSQQEAPATFDERFGEQPEQPEQSIPGVRGFVEPFRSYPGTQGQMARESAQQMGEGVSRLGRAFTPKTGPRVGPFPDEQAANVATGLGEVAAGGLGYVTSPINAALRTVVGKPVEDATGVPKEYTEFAAGMAMPIPKKINLPARAEPRAAPVAKAAPTTEELFDAASEGYTKARASKFQMAPEQTAELSAGIRANLNEAGYRDFLTPKTFRAIEELKLDAPSNVADIEAVRRALNIAAKDPAEKDAARRAINAIDDRLGGPRKVKETIDRSTPDREFVTTIEREIGPAVPELTAARGNYAAASRSEAIQEVTEKAQRQAGAANSGQNIDNATRQQIKSILNSQTRRRGYSADELAQMEEIVAGSKAGNAARFAGNLMGGGGGLGSVVTAGVGGAATGGWGAVAPVFGYAFKKLGNKLTADQVTKLDEMVRARSPLGQAVGSSVKAWSEAVQVFEIEPSVKNFVRLSIASRNLSNTARGAQISMSPDSLLKSATGGVKATAEDEQVDPERVVNQ